MSSITLTAIVILVLVVFLFLACCPGVFYATITEKNLKTFVESGERSDYLIVHYRGHQILPKDQKWFVKAVERERGEIVTIYKESNGNFDYLINVISLLEKGNEVAKKFIIAYLEKNSGEIYCTDAYAIKDLAKQGNPLAEQILPYIKKKIGESISQ